MTRHHRARLLAPLGFVLGLIFLGLPPLSGVSAGAGTDHAAVDAAWQVAVLPPSARGLAPSPADGLDAALPSPAALPVPAGSAWALGPRTAPAPVPHPSVVPPVRGPPAAVA